MRARGEFKTSKLKKARAAKNHAVQRRARGNKPNLRSRNTSDRYKYMEPAHE